MIAEIAVKSSLSPHGSGSSALKLASQAFQSVLASPSLVWSTFVVAIGKGTMQLGDGKFDDGDRP